MPDRNDEPLPERARVPHPRRCDAANPNYGEILRRHEDALMRNEATYVDPQTGYAVFTAGFLWARGFCCDSGCRHCPYVVRP